MADLPDWFAASVIKGLYGTELKTIQVDELGRLYAILRALYGTTQKDVQCDASGNLTLNVKAQDLAEVINRPKYGAHTTVLFNNYVNASSDTTLFSVSGKGIIYAMLVAVMGANVIDNDYVKYTFDGGTEISSPTILQGIQFNFTDVYEGDFSVYCYDNTNYRYAVRGFYGITFETSFVMKYTETYGRTPYVLARLFHALL